MARARLISCSLGGSRRFHALASVAGPLTEFAQLLYPLIVINADDFGRLAADAESVKFQVFPSSQRSFPDFDAALVALDAVGLIGLYDTDGAKYLQVNKFEEHQQGLHKRTKSKLPEFAGKFREIPASRARAEENRTELNRTEGKGTEEKRRDQETNRGGAAALSQASTNQDVSTARKSSAAGAARRTAGNNGHKPETTNVRVITKIAHEAIDLVGVRSPDLPETVKELCARRKVLYNSTAVRKAIESAAAQRRHHA